MAQRENDGLTRPIIVNILGGLFLLSPWLNLVGNLYHQNVSRWYSPSMWWVFSHQITLVSWTMLGLLFLSGLALLYPRKLSWYFALFVLEFVFVYNFLIGENTGKLPSYIHYGLNGAVLLILYFCRYPYLDRRGYLFIAKRYVTQLPVVVNGVGGQFSLINLSKSGAFLEKIGKTPTPELGTQLQIEIEGLFEFQGQVVRKTENGFGVRITSIESTNKAALLQFITRLQQELADD